VRHLAALKEGYMFGIGLFEIIILILFFGVIPWLFAFVDILRSDFKGNNKLIWLIAVIFVPFFGFIAYLFIGRKQKTGSS
jgi:hypothetical protein